ncbi:hypothetical protein ABZ816_27390 [Actinosynnema sp. NPDC047251]|uniref:Dual OB-containing domain-containing protein n=1 Tax=Saccharothrix espanaensis (strain ATCC 51144 / DSM 44229 / JCM 9112 / NBRC 15066 / NRRL 15764) TaxID=1179773 RepID=K0JWZ9_SACES|nr:hypothetical protein [Saccharothrix espanaensis]CCH28728.1 hypothetical protein BN6_14040 [Saccharothrix espanaensis DSM 44229]
MAVTKELVCLANSRKYMGRCVAGMEILDGSRRWIRPVSNRTRHEVSAAERQYRGAVEPQVLDVISVPLVAPRPIGFQRENWLLDPRLRWQKVRRIDWDELCTLEEHPRSLWINGYHTSAGFNDRVPVEQGDRVVDSLKLIRVHSATIEVRHAHPNAMNQRPTVRARFRYAGSTYRLKVTDPVHEEKFRANGLGNHQLSESFLTVSLGEEFEGDFYKLVAAIVERTDVNLGSRR